jgi:tetratricopeptide (TPR) repeat protein
MNATKNHYETLGIAKTATNEEIKRAYYGLVRQYAPDRSPEEFKKINAAYEVLSDSNRRAEYDLIGELPDSVVAMLRDAEQQLRIGNDNKGFGIYRKILIRHPRLDTVRERYATHLELCNKEKNAAKVWKHLCKRHPNNAVYARKLGGCYQRVGKQKEAYTEIQRALALDEKSIEAWILLSTWSMQRKQGPDWFDTIRTIVEEAIRVVESVKTDEWKKIQLYYFAFVFTDPKNHDTSVEYLHEINRLIRENSRHGQTEGEMAFKTILKDIPIEGLGRVYPELKEMAGLLPQSATEEFSDDMDKIKLRYDIRGLPKRGFSKMFRELFEVLTTDFPEESDAVDIAAVEYVLLRERLTYNPQIKRLKAEFPDLYALHETFFDEALQTDNPESMRRQRTKLLDDRRVFDTEDLLDIENAPIHRDQPKVGRNDPCPCGSGKKYKKCCGLSKPLQLPTAGPSS